MSCWIDSTVRMDTDRRHQCQARQHRERAPRAGAVDPRAHREATGEARSRTTLAERALTAIADTTGAQYGAIVLAHGEAGRLIASRNFPSALQSVVDRPWSEAPAVRAVTAVGSVVKGSVDRLPLAALSRTTFLDSGIRTMLAVGLHREEELVGVLSLGWATEGIPCRRTA